MDSQKWTLVYISMAFIFISSSSAGLLVQQVTEGRGTENNSSYSLTANPAGVTRIWRKERPSSKIVTIAGFCDIKGAKPFQFSVFEAAGYKWGLVLYVDGNKNDGGDGHISLYVRIEETESLPKGWEVNVDLKLFVHNGKLHKYLVVTDGAIKRYTDAKKEWGFGQLILRSTFCDKTEGYIEQGFGSFGAEIFIFKPAQQQEKLTIISNPPNNVFTWKMNHFSKLKYTYYVSDDFLVGDRYWRLGLWFWPGSDLDLKIKLLDRGHTANAVVTSTFVGVNLRLMNQRTTNHKQIYTEAWCPFEGSSGSYFSLEYLVITRAELDDALKGYLVNDKIIFEAEIVKVSVTNIVSADEFLNIQQVIEDNSSYSLKADPDGVITRMWREERPSTKIVTLTSYSEINGARITYESTVFEAAGYKWRFELYLACKNDAGNDYIELYVKMEETESLPKGWEVNVDLRLFIYNGKLRKYLTVTDGTVKRYSGDYSKMWGYDLIPGSTFCDKNQGYIEQDTVTVGAEMFIVKPTQQQEKLTFITNPPNNVFTWKIPHFSTLEHKYYYSEDFLIGDRYWRLGFYPKGVRGALPIFLFAQGYKANAVVTNTFGGVNLRLMNQLSTNHKQRYAAAWFPVQSGEATGVQAIIKLAELKDASKGYLVNDAIIFEAEMVYVSVTNIVSA